MKDILRYAKLTSTRIDNTYPTAYIPVPVQEDYNNGFISRYFVQRRDVIHSPIIEVSSITVSKYASNVYFNTISLRWRISGNIEDEYTQSGILTPSVISTNTQAILAAAKIMPSISSYLVNPKQFWKSDR